jgi:hypothetical protein
MGTDWENFCGCPMSWPVAVNAPVGKLCALHGLLHRVQPRKCPVGLVTIIHPVCEGVELGVTTLRGRCWAYGKIE